MKHETETLASPGFTSLKDLETYFKFIGNDNEIHTFALFDRELNTPVPGYGTFHSKWKDIPAKYFELGTLHMVLNRTNLRGRKLENIESCRVLAVDIDSVTESKQIKKIATKYNTGLVAQSSPGKFHLYWKIASDIPLETWSKIQFGLAAGLNGDKALSQPNKMLRVPGVVRKLGDQSYIPSVVWLSENPLVLTYDGILALFPELNKWIAKAEREQKEAREKLRQLAKDRLAGKEIGALDYTNLGRNNALYYTVKDAVGTFVPGQPVLSYELASELINEVNAKLDHSLYTSEVANILKSSYSKGLARWESKNLAYKGYVEKLTETDNHTNGIASSTINQPGSDQVSTKVETFEYDYSDPILRNNRFTELGIVARIIQRYGPELLRLRKNFFAFSPNRNVWEGQSGSVHPELYGFYQDVILDILKDPKFLDELCMTKDGTVSVDKIRRMQEKYMSSRMVRTVINLVLNSDVRQVDHDIFDAVPELLHTGSGLFNMSSGELRAARATDYLLARNDVDLSRVPTTNVGGLMIANLGSDCPFWTDFLAEVFAENENCGEMIRFMQELFGYSISGSISEQKIFCHYGPGANGKSKVLSALLRLSGGYGTIIDPDELARNKKGFAKSFERFGAKIEGKRLAIIDDIDVETVWNEGFVKNVTGPRLRARAEYEKSRDISNRCKVHLGLNVPPSPEAENYGILRRLCVIPYARTFEHMAHISDQIDRGIEENLLGILGWSVAGFRRVVSQGGIIYPEETVAAAEEYRQEHFSIETTLDQLFSETTEDKWEFLDDLVDDVNKYLGDSGLMERTTPDKLGRVLRQKYGVPKKLWCNRRKNTFRAYNLKLNFERQTGLNQL